MKNSKSLKAKVVATVLASVCAVSALGAVAVSANDGMGRYTNSSQQSISYRDTERYNTPFEYKCYGATSYGYDWTYSIDSLNVSVDCDYNFSNNQYTFHVKGEKEGYVNAVLMYVNAQEEWVKVPMKLYVDKNLNVSRADSTSQKNTSCYDSLKNIIQRENVYSYAVVKTHDDDFDKLVVFSKDKYDMMHFEFYRIGNNRVTKLGSYGADGVSTYIDYETGRLGMFRIDEDGIGYFGRLTAVNEGISIDWNCDGYISWSRAILNHGRELIFTDKDNLSLIEAFR